MSYLCWKAFGKNLYYKYTDFKKVSGKIEYCKLSSIDIYKYTKENKIILFGAKGEYIPCITGSGTPDEKCEYIIASLTSCVTTFDNLSKEKVYNFSNIHNKLNYVKDIIVQDEKFQAEYTKSQEEKSVNTIYKDIKNNTTLTLKNEKGIDFGSFEISNINNSEILVSGEWVVSDTDKNKIDFTTDKGEVFLATKQNTQLKVSILNKDYIFTK